MRLWVLRAQMWLVSAVRRLRLPDRWDRALERMSNKLKGEEVTYLVDKHV